MHAQTLRAHPHSPHPPHPHRLDLFCEWPSIDTTTVGTTSFRIIPSQVQRNDTEALSVTSAARPLTTTRSLSTRSALCISTDAVLHGTRSGPLSGGSVQRRKGTRPRSLRWHEWGTTAAKGFDLGRDHGHRMIGAGRRMRVGFLPLIGPRAGLRAPPRIRPVGARARAVIRRGSRMCLCRLGREVQARARARVRVRTPIRTNPRR